MGLRSLLNILLSSDCAALTRIPTTVRSICLFAIEVRIRE
jgi:tRNA U34 5-carboxymethylaminomethyl modifying GTPase MnmE/TrmE